MVMDFSKFSDDELLSMYNSSQPIYGVDRHSIMESQALNNILPNRAAIQDFVDKQIYSPTSAPSVKTAKLILLLMCHVQSYFLENTLQKCTPCCALYI